MQYRKGARRLAGTLGAIFIVNCIVLVFLVLGFGREYLRNREIEHNIRLLEEEQVALQGEQLEALSLLEVLSSEYYLEREARTKHGLASPGEELVILHAAEAKNESDVSLVEQDVSNLRRWYYYFFDHERFLELRSSV